MPLIEAETKHSIRFLLLAGIPAFVIAVIISMCIHQYAHMAVKKYSCDAAQTGGNSATGVSDNADGESDCPAAAFAGIVSTFLLALLSFALFIHHPRNLLLASMAFVNAATRVPESFIVFFQLMFRQGATHVADESVALQLMHFKDPTAFVVILCFYTLTLLFLTITVIHDIKFIPHKWLIASLLFAALIPFENLLWRIIAPLFGPA